MGLRDTIERLAAEAHGSARHITPTPVILEGWQMAVSQLYRQIEAYLIDYLLKGAIRLTPHIERQFVSRVGPVEATLLDIVVGSRIAHLVPRLDLDARRIGTVGMSDGEGGPELVFTFTDTGTAYDWTIRAPERGVRRMLAGYLPDRQVPLNEELFKAALDVALLGRQPVVTYDPEVVRERLATVLDSVTAAEMDVRLARLASERWVPGLKSRTALVASTLRASAGEVLTRVQGPRPLLLESPEREGGATSADDAGDPASHGAVPRAGL